MDLSLKQRLGTILSQFANVLLGGHPDQTLSARSYYDRHRSRFWAWVYRRAESLFGEGHCYQSAQADKGFAQYVMELPD